MNIRPRSKLAASLRAYKAQLINDSLNAHRGNQSATAHALGISRCTLIRYMQELGLTKAAKIEQMLEFVRKSA